ncbi:MAG: enterotoxin [Acidobacteria bacterium]|nr:enterotoxin [Acidobacteriota bacterium]
MALEFPGRPPGAAVAKVGSGELVVSNDLLACRWTLSDGRLRPASVEDKLSGRTLEFAQDSECIHLVFIDGQMVRASEMKVIGSPRVESLPADTGSANLARRQPGKQIVVRLAAPSQGLEVEWRAVLRDGSNYVRPCVTLRAKDRELGIRTVALVDVGVRGDGARVVGQVPGSPVVMDGFFLAYEHANSSSSVQGSTEGGGPPAQRVSCKLDRNAPLRAGEEVEQTSVIGLTPPGQLRRGFLYYVERERAHPYRPFLHYNSWYDISWGDRRPTEAECLAAIERFGKELIQKRGVKMKCFLWDDGWDDPQTLWQTNKKNFPNGFVKLLEAARKYDSTLGFWMSPWGGYGEFKSERLAYGRKQGFEMEGEQFSMAGPQYFKRFLETSLEMIRENGCNHFKYDGMNAGRVEQNEAMIRLIARLRQAKPDLFVNMTTGTWPSVFYLWYGDSTWRGGGDMGWHGKGSKRQQWVTYRDWETYRSVVLRGLLYPLNSLMTQGFVHARYGTAGELGDDPREMCQEARSFFASGTAVQELYVTPQKMTDRNWDDLAEAAHWGQANADVLVDTHWVGGDPDQGVYGWASWNRRKGILALRNPDPAPGRIAIDIGKAFELPEGAAREYVLRSPWKEDADRPPMTLSASREFTFDLQPFEVLVFDAISK